MLCCEIALKNCSKMNCLFDYERLYGIWYLNGILIKNCPNVFWNYIINTIYENTYNGKIIVCTTNKK